tara:strand:+ start:834 stop:1085 length:252 start_codon:yes stop_codon:yes gene_type:complete
MNPNTTKEIYDNILEELIIMLKDIFGNVSPRDEKTIRNNFTIKDSSFNDLGQGMKNVIHMMTPILFDKYHNDLIESLPVELKE